MIVRLSDMQRTAGEHGFAVPHFLGGNLEMTYGAILAAEELNSPIAFGVAPEVFACIPMEVLFPMILNIAQRANVPVAVQLEHGKSFEQAATALKLGVNSVMFDGSDLSYEENVAKTQEISKMAHAFGACVEAELGHVGGSALREANIEDKGQNTDPDLLKDFIEKTKVDTLAVSFGNVHGRYRSGVPVIDLDLARRLVTASSVPLVMHGGSGLSDDVYRGVVKAGITNIHFYSCLAMHAWDYINNRIGKNDPYPAYHEVVSYGIDFYCERTKKLIKLLLSEGHASDFKFS